MLEKDIYPLIASELKAKPHQVEAAAKLLDEGNTVPFIARYRKEATGSLEDEQLRELENALRTCAVSSNVRKRFSAKSKNRASSRTNCARPSKRQQNCRNSKTSICLTSRKNVRAPRLPANAVLSL